MHVALSDGERWPGYTRMCGPGSRHSRCKCCPAGQGAIGPHISQVERFESRYVTQASPLTRPWLKGSVNLFFLKKKKIPLGSRNLRMLPFCWATLCDTHLWYC